MPNIFSTSILSLTVILLHFWPPRIHIKFVNANRASCMCRLSAARSRFIKSHLLFRQNLALIMKMHQMQAGIIDQLIFLDAKQTAVFDNMRDYAGTPLSGPV